MDEATDKLLSEIDDLKKEIIVLEHENHYLNNKIDKIGEAAELCNTYGGCKVYNELNFDGGIE